MTRLLLPALMGLVLLAAVSAACGGNDDAPEDEGSPPATGTPADGDPSPAPNAGSTRSPLNTPTAVPEGEPLFVAAGAGATIRPTSADFGALPATEVDGSSGVSIATLASEVGAPEGATVTIQGQIDGATEERFARGLVEELAETTILVNEDGRVRLISTVLPEEQLLDSVSVVSFQ